VAASQGVQEAGKKVARENAFLRSLLMLCGVTDKQVKEYLESRTDTESTSRLPNQTAGPPSSSHNLQNPLPELDTRGTGYLPLMSAAQGEKTGRVSTPGPNTVGTVSEAQRLGGYTGIGQSASCENAAEIIASLRDHPDILDVRSELGCDSDSRCMVKNMSIFEILDKSRK
jgi:hypothetical protein